MSKIILLLTAMLVIINNQNLYAQEGVYKVIIEKEKRKEAKRWTLADWLSTKERNRQMDMWLALHSSDTDYEFYFNLDYATQSTTESNSALGIVDQAVPVYRAGFAAYATIIGLEYKFSKMGDYRGSKSYINLRIFGTSNQNTNFTLFYGNRNYTETILSSLGDEQFKNDFLGFSYTLYLLKHFGLQVNVENYLAKGSDKSLNFDGSLIETTIFVGYGFMRVYGTMSKEPIKYTQLSTSTTLEWARDGLYGGVKLFF
ncbi:MAG: hypothetical protein HOO06_01600 [Bdellovibrionaceae bacterium]|jgi:hypothetical protein|nr:hypothetical protein [Pseudobdellovibrionaceae bacterium]